MKDGKYHKVVVLICGVLLLLLIVVTISKYISHSPETSIQPVKAGQRREVVTPKREAIRMGDVRKDNNRNTEQKNIVAVNIQGLPFTVDAYLGRIPDLKATESLGEFTSSEKFVADFIDGAGIITGEYFKKSRKLQHLVVVGSGPTFKKAVEQAILLSIKDNSSEAKQGLLNILRSNDLSKYSITVDALTFTFTTMGDQPIFTLSNANDSQKTQEKMRDESTVGVSLGTFKSSFNARMSQLNPKLKFKDTSEETTSPRLFEYNFAKDTTIFVNVNNKMQIECIELDSAFKEASVFWACADATIAAMKPGIAEAEREAILYKIGGGDHTHFPAISTDFEDGELQYNCILLKFSDGCALLIQSNQP